MQQVFKAYTVTGRYLQSKLPIDSPTLQSLSALDPLARGHSVTMTHLHHLFDSFQHLLPIGEHFDVHAEVMQYNVDASIDKMEEENVIKFWVSKQMKDRYPQLTRIAAAALSCFHGAAVESSFNIMGDIVTTKRSRTTVTTFNAYQTVKYSLRTHQKTAIDRFRRTNVLHSPIDKNLMFNIQRAWRKEKDCRQKSFCGQKIRITSKSVSDARKAEVNLAIRKHLKKSRARALRILNK